VIAGFFIFMLRQSLAVRFQAVAGLNVMATPFMQ